MKQVAGWWCPQVLSGPGNYLARWQRLDAALAALPRWQNGPRRVAVQAGGHIGVWPMQLGELFERVYTFEPEPANFACLVRNAAGAGEPGIFAFRAALGCDHGCVDLKVHTGNSGQHQLRAANAGAVPTLRIDDLNLDACDAVLLDVEGFEIAALTGAHKTLQRCRPLVVVEENKRCRTFGHQPGDLEVHLRLLGYRLAGRCDEDLIFLPA